MATAKQDKNQERPEGDTFLAMVDAKIAALQSLRSSYMAALSVGAFGPAGDSAAFSGLGAPSGTIGGPPVELPRGALLGKSIPAAIRLYLAAVKKKQTIREVATALREGGVESTAKNFAISVQSAMYRLQEAGVVLRFKEGWALAEFYPESLRNRIAEQDAKPKRNKRRASRPKSPRVKAKKGPETGGSGATGLSDRIESFIRAQRKPVEAKEIVAAMGEPANVVGLAIGRLRKQNRIKKEIDGAFTSAA
jgi:hypothetical protein